MEIFKIHYLKTIFVFILKGIFVIMKLNRLKDFFLQCFGTIIGSCIMAISVSLFLLPNELSTGGFSGIATILYYLLKLPMGTTILILNIPLFIFSGFKIGKKFFIKSIIGTVGLSLFIDMFDKLEPLTDDKLLASIYGGILTGLGTAIILKSHSSTGGSDLVTNIIKEYKPLLKTGSIITIIDAIVVLSNVVFLGNIEIGLYSAIAIYLMGKIIDILFEGIYFTKLLFIVSEKNNEISSEIKNKIKRGVTGLYGKGMYRNNDKLILMCAVRRNDISNIKQLVRRIDKNAFIIVTNSREVLGMGFNEEIM